MSRRVAVIGAGWSGLACALESAGRSDAVCLFDAAPHVGGRARAVRVTLGDREFALDNGQHLMIGAYSETLRLMREVGVDADAALLRLPFEMRFPDGFLLRARRLPAPLHLVAAVLTGRRLGWQARWQLLRWVSRWRRRGWTLEADAPASSLFGDTPAETCRRLWRPLCLAALNLEPEQASAQMLLHVLRDSLAAGAQAADLLIPRRDLSAVFAEPALAQLRRLGVAVHLRTPVQRLLPDGAGWRLVSRGSPHGADAVVLALPPERAAALLAETADERAHASASALRSIETMPIATVYLRYPAATRLPQPAYALLDDVATGRYGQWVFDRGRLDADNAGVLSVVISDARAASALEPAQLATKVAAQLSADLGLPAPTATAVIVEKRATIRAAPGLQRPPARLPLAGLYLAGDAAAGDYPSTLEGSVRAGIAAARALIADERSAG